MNRLVFNEGGQPVYLDDLKLLQDNDVDANRRLFETITEHTSVFLLDKIEGKIVSVDQNKGLTTFDVAEGVVVIEGEFISFPRVRLTINSWDVPIYVCIKDTLVENRTFQDGQTRPCVRSRHAYISTDKNGADQAYETPSLPSLKDLLCKFVGTANNGSSWRPVPVKFFNGYSGRVQISKRKDSTRVSVNIESKNEEWDAQHPAGKLFDVEMVAGGALSGHCSSLFRTGGQNKKLCTLEVVGYTFFLRAISSTSAEAKELESPSLCPVSLLFEILE